MKPLFYCYLAPGDSSEAIHYYLATNLKHTGCKIDPDEIIGVLMLTKEEALQMIMSNEIEDAKTICRILCFSNLYKELK